MQSDPLQSTAPLGHASTPAVATPVEVADRCRELLLELTSGTRALGRNDLLTWLARYHEIAVWTEPSRLHPDAHRRRAPIDRRHVEECREEAVAKVSAALLAVLHPDRGTAFVLDATVDGSIVPIVDDAGNRFWRPVDRRRCTLADRALALLAVDYLLRPGDYETAARQCDTCRRVWFDTAPTPLEGAAACCQVPAPPVRAVTRWRRRGRQSVHPSA